MHLFMLRDTNLIVERCFIYSSSTPKTTQLSLSAASSLLFSTKQLSALCRVTYGIQHMKRTKFYASKGFLTNFGWKKKDAIDIFHQQWAYWGHVKLLKLERFVFMNQGLLHLFINLCVFWFLEKNTLCKICVSGTVLMIQLPRNSPTNVYIN